MTWSDAIFAHKIECNNREIDSKNLYKKNFLIFFFNMKSVQYLTLIVFVSRIFKKFIHNSIFID